MTSIARVCHVFAVIIFSFFSWVLDLLYVAVQQLPCCSVMHSPAALSLTKPLVSLSIVFFCVLGKSGTDSVTSWTSHTEVNKPVKSIISSLKILLSMEQGTGKYVTKSLYPLYSWSLCETVTDLLF